MDLSLSVESTLWLPNADDGVSEAGSGEDVPGETKQAMLQLAEDCQLLDEVDPNNKCKYGIVVEGTVGVAKDQYVEGVLLIAA